jgi:hypothetical protein
MLILSLLALTLILIHWHINREFYADIPIPILGRKVFMSYTVVRSSAPAGTIHIQSSATLNNISVASMYLLYLQLSAITILTFLALREFTNVIRSVRGVRTFVVQNTRSLKKIGLFLLSVFLLSGIQYSSYKESVLFGLYFHLTLLMMSLLAFTLSEIFKEGNALLEENMGTI